MILMVTPRSRSLLDKSHPSLAGHQVGRDHEHLAPGFSKDSLKLLQSFWLIVWGHRR